MKTTIEQSKDARIVTKTIIDKDTEQSAEKKALEALKKQVEVKGFRIGNAPEHLVRERVGTDGILEETVRVLLPKVVEQAIKQSDAKPIIRPKISIRETNPLTIEVIFIERPKATVKKPQTITIEKKDTIASTSDVETFIEKLLRQDRTEEEIDKSAEQGDAVNLTIESKENGEIFKDFTLSSYRIVLGEEELIPELAAHVLGMKKGEVKTINIQFSKTHDIPVLRNKKLDVTLNVQRVALLKKPLLTEEYVTQRLKTQSTVASFKDEVQKMLTQQKLKAEMERREQELFDKIKEATQVTLPQELVQEELEEMLKDVQERLKEQKVTMEQWVKASGKTSTDIINEMRDIADGRLKLRYGMEELANVKKVEISDAEVELALKKVQEDPIPSPGSHEFEAMRFDLKMRKIVDLMIGDHQ